MPSKTLTARPASNIAEVRSQQETIDDKRFPCTCQTNNNNKNCMIEPSLK